MKNNYLSPIIAFLCGIVLTAGVIKFWDPCLFCQSPAATGANFQNSGNIPDDSLDNYMWRVFHNSSGNFIMPYNAANLKVTIAGSNVTLIDDGQDCSYASAGSTVKYNTSSAQTYMSSTNVMSSDINRSVTYCGPFDPTAGTFYTNRGKLHFLFTGGADTTLGPVSRLVWLDQNVSGQPGGIAVAFLSQIDVQQ